MKEFGKIYAGMACASKQIVFVIGKDELQGEESVFQQVVTFVKPQISRITLEFIPEEKGVEFIWNGNLCARLIFENCDLKFF